MKKSALQKWSVLIIILLGILYLGVHFYYTYKQVEAFTTDEFENCMSVIFLDSSGNDNLPSSIIYYLKTNKTETIETRQNGSLYTKVRDLDKSLIGIEITKTLSELRQTYKKIYKLCKKSEKDCSKVNEKNYTKFIDGLTKLRDKIKSKKMDLEETHKSELINRIEQYGLSLTLPNKNERTNQTENED
jgi:hypothetical protein